jgi:hypothetical protein
MSRGLSAHDDFVSDVSNRNGRPLVAHKDGRDRSSCWPGDLCPAVRQRLMERAEGPDQATVRTWRGSAMPFSWCVPHSANSKRGDRQHKARFRPFGPQRGLADEARSGQRHPTVRVRGRPGQGRHMAAGAGPRASEAEVAARQRGGEAASAAAGRARSPGRTTPPARVIRPRRSLRHRGCAGRRVGTDWLGRAPRGARSPSRSPRRR